MIEKLRLAGSCMFKSMLVLFVTLIAAIFFLSSCDNSNGFSSEDNFLEDIDTFVTERMDSEVSGFVFIVVKDGEIAFSKGWGMANTAAGIPFNPNTPSYLASLTKQFTATAILILFEQELLSLETKIIEHFPEFPAAWSEITVHHLLTHQSGISNYTDFFGNSDAGAQGLTNQEVFELILQHDNLDFLPGEQASYSNSGYLILAMLVERITNISYPDFLEEEIFAPLGMNSTFVRNDSVPDPTNMALNYDEKNELSEYDYYAYGAGGIYSTLDDMYKWDQALYSDQIVSQSTLQLAFIGYTGGQNDFGYGWMVAERAGYPSLRHGGYGPPGFLNYIYRVPGKHFMYLMMSNGGVFANDGFDTWTNELMDKIFTYYL